MKRLRSVCLSLWLGAAAVHAGPAEDAIVAIMRLSEEPNYSWVSTVADDARTYEIEGRTSGAGFSQVKMPVINSVRRRLGREAADTQFDVIFRGNNECVLRTDKGWIRPENLPEPEAISDFDRLGANARAAGAIVAPSVKTQIMNGSVVRRPRLITPPPPERDTRYSNLQLAISPPHEELAIIIGSHTEFKVDGAVVSGTLTGTGAQLLLVRDGQKDITPVRATGDFKIWVRDGRVARYQVNLEGALLVTTAKRPVTVTVQQRATTVIRDVGTTKVDVPDAARLALSQ